MTYFITAAASTAGFLIAAVCLSEVQYAYLAHILESLFNLIIVFTSLIGAGALLIIYCLNRCSVVHYSVQIIDETAAHIKSYCAAHVLDMRAPRHDFVDKVLLLIQP